MPLVGLASQFYPIPSVFFLEGSGRLHIALQPAVYTKYTTGGAFEIMASHDTSVYIDQVNCLPQSGTNVPIKSHIASLLLYSCGKVTLLLQ